DPSQWGLSGNLEGYPYQTVRIVDSSRSGRRFRQPDGRRDAAGWRQPASEREPAAPEPTRQTMQTALNAAVERYLRAKTLSRGTRNEYRSTVRKWERWGRRVPVEELRRRDV